MPNNHLRKPLLEKVDIFRGLEHNMLDKFPNVKIINKIIKININFFILKSLYLNLQLMISWNQNTQLKKL